MAQPGRRENDFRPAGPLEFDMPARQIDMSPAAPWLPFRRSNRIIVIEKDFLAERRDLLLWPLAAALLSAAAPLRAAERVEGTPFSRRTVPDLARTLASAAFRPPAAVPEELKKLTREQYRSIQYRKDLAVWGRAPTRFSIEMLAPGFLYRDLVEVDVVENGRARPLPGDHSSFKAPSEAIAKLLAQAGKFAGFRLNYPLRRKDTSDEFLTFQGASYFRGLSRGQRYGLSARGLAVDVAEPGGEEKPLFRHFWIERPPAGVDNIVVHALLDSRRVAGAFRFGIYPGKPLTMDVEAELYPRTALRHVGLAPLTSMFLFGPMDRDGIQDYRPAVHNSHGLAMINGRGERIWRPVSNPTTLQISQFMDKSPAGFGLVQRDRNFHRYQDLEARFDRRPSAWIEPRGDWGPGHIQLVEIPSRSQGNDNIVAYWRPRDGLKAGQPFTYAYRLTWPDDAPAAGPLARVVYSAYSRAAEAENRRVVIDYAGDSMRPGTKPEIEASVNPGQLVRKTVRDNPKTGGVRIFITFNTGDAKSAELRVQPKMNGEALGETWLYRWTAE
jgi:glucan biosynthesis protein